MAKLEFDCGTVVNVGAPGMAIKAHIATCKNVACVADCNKQLPKYTNVLI